MSSPHNFHYSASFAHIHVPLITFLLYLAYLQISNTNGHPLTSFKRLSNLDRLRAVQPQYRIGFSDGSRVSALAVD